jgi:lysophospholipase L1-like esterase
MRYIAEQKMSAFVYDYDHNAPSIQHLEKTHYEGYRIFREKQPTTPVIMASKPDFYFPATPESLAANNRRREIIRQTYERAKAQGDENVYFVDGAHFYPEAFRGDCTSDGCHPNDYGYALMAQTFASILKDLI